MPYCAVKWCGKCSATSSLTKDGITFHRFPNCPNLKQQWINATKRGDNWFPGKTHVICSRHFTDDCFRPTSGNRRFLFDTAVPTQMLPSLTSTLSLTEIKDENICTLDTQTSSSNEPTNISLSKGDQNVLVLVSTSKKKPEATIQDICINPKNSEETLYHISSTCSTPRERRLYRTVVDLSLKVKKKNAILKRLRDSNRLLKRKVNLLKQQLGELGKKK
nr:THAP domain-containing protein 2-like isoform X1 [Plodia interpunctella]